MKKLVLLAFLLIPFCHQVPESKEPEIKPSENQEDLRNIL